MPNLSLQAFAASMYAGQQLNTELENRKEDVEMKKQQIASSKADMAFREQQRAQQQAQSAAMAKIANDFDSNLQRKQVDSGESPDVAREQALDAESAKYRTMGKAMMLADPTKAEGYFKLADANDSKKDSLRKSNLEIAEKKVKDSASYAGAVLAGDVSPQDSYRWTVEHEGLAAAQKIPTDPEGFKKYWLAKKDSGISAEARLTNERLLHKEAEDEKDRRQREKDRQADRAEARADRALRREEMLSNKAPVTKEVDGKILEFDPSKSLGGKRNAADPRWVEIGAGKTSQSDKKQQRDLSQMSSQAAEVVRGLHLIGSLDAGTTTGVFAHMGDPSTLHGSLLKAGGNKLTNAQQQMLGSATEGLGLEMAQVATIGAGARASVPVIKGFQAMVASQPNDTQFEAAFRLANGADFVATRLENMPNLVDPLEQAKRDATIKKLRAYAQPEDIIKAAREAGHKFGKKMMTLSEKLKEYGDKAEAEAKAKATPEDVQNLLEKYK